MEKYYKITKEQAEALSCFEYAEGKLFDPFVGEQKDGTYLVDEKMHALLEDHPKFKKIDWVEAEIITLDQSEPKFFMGDQEIFKQ